VSNYWKYVAESWRWIVQRIARILKFMGGGGGTIPDDKCCSLARRDRECTWYGSKEHFICPEGFYRHWWICCEGAQQVACGECTQNTASCFGGHYDCSIWWYTGQSC